MGELDGGLRTHGHRLVHRPVADQFETRDVAWFAPVTVLAVPPEPGVRSWIEHALSATATPYFEGAGPPRRCRR